RLPFDGSVGSIVASRSLMKISLSGTVSTIGPVESLHAAIGKQRPTLRRRPADRLQLPITPPICANVLRALAPPIPNLLPIKPVCDNSRQPGRLTTFTGSLGREQRCSGPNDHPRIHESHHESPPTVKFKHAAAYGIGDDNL